MEAPNDFKLISFPGKIHLITSDEQLVQITDSLLAASQLGFDTETRPSFKKGEIYNVALLQLSTETDAYLIRLHHVTKLQSIKQVFESPNILKVGVAIRDDIKTLQKLFEFRPQNFIELQDLAKEKGMKNFGLKGMTEEILQARLSKRAKTSNWQASELKPEQILYAATDAWIGLELYKKMKDIVKA